MSSQSNPNTEPTEAEDRRDARQDPTEGQTLGAHRRGVARQQAHDRQMNLTHHRGQTHEVHGGRTAARQQGLTDSSRGRGRAVPRVGYGGVGGRGGMGASPEGGQPEEERVTTSGPAPVGTSHFAQEVLRGKQGQGTLASFGNPEAAARERDPIRATPLPMNHPAVTKEVKFDRISRLMQPGSDDEVDQRLSSGIEGYDDGLVDYDPDDDWIS